MIDIRNLNREIFSLKQVHSVIFNIYLLLVFFNIFLINFYKKIITTIDWNPYFPNTFASGSLDKEIKVINLLFFR